MDVQAVNGPATPGKRKSEGLSYKFQRLRERLRQAIAGGELAGKLPGERALARRFHVNAKTLSKALTDLAAEGLLDRSIGRGTYIKGSAPEAAPQLRRWLVVGDPQRINSTLGKLLQAANPDARMIQDVSALRPSFLKQFEIVIDFGTNTSESFLRDMVVRNMTVVAVNREPGVYSVNLVAVDRALGANLLARDMLLAGHRRLAVVQSLTRSSVPHAVQQAAARYAPDAIVQVCGKDQIVDIVRSGATAVMCDACLVTTEVRGLLEAAQILVPDHVSLGAVGCFDESNTVSGYFADCDLTLRTITEVARQESAGHPVSLWIAPQWLDKGTIRPAAPNLAEQAA